MRQSGFLKLVLAITIAATFALFRIGTGNLVAGRDTVQLARRSEIQRIPNKDASLSIPFLDKISKYWYVGGAAEIRNTAFVRLTRAGSVDQHGLILSNGLGDNTIDNFETVVKFRVSPKTGSTSSSLMGDGIAIVITPEKDFLMQDLLSSYARRQYHINSGGIVAGDTGMMGLPRNLPGLALIIDTHKNYRKVPGAVPFLDVLINTEPAKQEYDPETDGEMSAAIKLNEKKIRLKRSLLAGDIVQLRLIYLESENFLKIDVQYAKEGDYWIELIRTHLTTALPRNSESNQRYIGISASTGQVSQTVDILGIETNEFHLKDEDDSSKEFLREMELYFLQEFDDKYALEEDDYQRWKMSNSRPRYEVKEETTTKSEKKHNSFIKSFTSFFIILVCIYLASIYIRICIKHYLNARRRAMRNSRELPL